MPGDSRILGPGNESGDAAGPGSGPAPGPGGARGKDQQIVRSIEPLLGYLVVVARGLKSRDQVGLDGASDLVQMTVVAAMENIGKGRLPGDGDGEVKAWLRGIMLNLHRQVRKRKRPLGGLVGEELADDTTSPSNKASRDELASRMVRARSRLRERDRLILNWRHEEKLTFEAIGRQLGVSDVAAHKAHRRALKQLEDAFLAISAEDALRQTRGRLEAVQGGEEPRPPR
jgi:RNA polymerase sigma factor (sigma-70 family)